jgi:hypothetical protein
MKKKILIGSLLVLTLLLLMPSIPAIQQKTIMDKSVIEKSNDELTKEHILFLFKGIIWIREFEYKRILIRTIFEIIKDGSATINEIWDIINLGNSNIIDVYLYADIKTIKTSDGAAACPLRAIQSLGGINVKNDLVHYIDDAFKEIHGWHLYVNGNLIIKKDGYILGYTGYIKNGIHGQSESFDLDGFGL